MDDLFLKIVRGEIPSAKVYEDERTYAFLDIHPNNKGHVLVVPKEKFRNIFDLDRETFLAMAAAAHMIARALKESLGADGVNIVMNNEPAAGQEVFHAHMHIIPRFENDGVFGNLKKTSYAEGEINMFAEKIRTALG